MKILFSPIGSADPVTTLGDGPMLHIVRHYRPDKVHLFYSPEMHQFALSDNRYEESIHLLMKDLNTDAPEISKIVSQENEAHRYDRYIKEFEQELEKLVKDYPEAEILVNVTSGTPAMQQALVAIDAFGRLPLRALQVSTPAKKMNPTGTREDPKEYDLETLWDLNLENDREPSSPNRCFEVESAHFCDLILRDNIRTLVSNYDYTSAAVLVAQSNSIHPRAINFIIGCKARLNLDNLVAAKCFGGTEFKYNPSDSLKEHISSLEVLLRRERWADYLRAMTPALTETLFKCVQKELPDSAWTSGDRGEKRIDVDKINNNSSLRNVLFPYPRQPDSCFVNNKHLCDLVRYYYESEDPKLCARIKSLRKLEEKTRHPLAHSIQRIEKQKLEQRGGITLEQSLQMLCDLTDTKPGLYARINEEILRLL